MARFVGGDFWEERPEAEMSDESRAWFEPIAKERWVENRKRDRADPLYPRGLGDSLGFGAGIRFPDPPGPLKVNVTKLPGGVLPDFLGPFDVSDRVRAKIEEIEPGVHQFLPLEVNMPDGSTSEHKYWIFCVMNRLDTIILEKSKFIQPYYYNQEKWPNYMEYEVVSGTKPIIALDKSKIAGKAAWAEYKFFKYLFSDTFASWLDAENIKGWEANDSFTRGATVIEV